MPTQWQQASNSCLSSRRERRRRRLLKDSRLASMPTLPFTRLRCRKSRGPDAGGAPPEAALAISGDLQDGWQRGAPKLAHHQGALAAEWHIRRVADRAAFCWKVVEAAGVSRSQAERAALSAEQGIRRSDRGRCVARDYSFVPLLAEAAQQERRFNRARSCYDWAYERTSIAPNKLYFAVLLFMSLLWVRAPIRLASSRKQNQAGISDVRSRCGWTGRSTTQKKQQRRTV